MTLFGLFSAPRPCVLNCPPENRRAEGGFLLGGAGVMILITIAIASSFNFVLRRDYDYKANFALGERLAEAATIAHRFAQRSFYQDSVNLSGLGNLFTNGMNPPNGMSFARIGASTLSLDVRGWNTAPIHSGATASMRAASAYMLLRIRTPANRVRLPSENVALFAGASSLGMTRVGMVGGAAASDTCDGAATRVRWGSEFTACLNAAHLTQLGFTNVQDGDMIAPAWEAALAFTDLNAVIRFPQPERAGLNLMRVNLAMNGDANNDGVPDRHSINNTGTMNGANMNMRNDTITGNAVGAATILQLQVRQNQPATFRSVVTNNSLSIIDQSGDPVSLTVATGDATFNGNNFTVGGTLQGNTTLDVTAANAGAITTLNNANINTTIAPIAGGAAPMVIADSIPVANNMTSVSIGGTRLSIGGTLDTDNPATLVNENVVMRSNVANTDMPVFTATLRTENTAQIQRNGGGSLPIVVQSMEQTGSTATRFLRADTLRSNDDCIGRACPDNVEDPPGGGL
jgi:hypothetical protein